VTAVFAFRLQGQIETCVTKYFGSQDSTCDCHEKVVYMINTDKLPNHPWMVLKDTT
jgi:hypothetical protein